MADKEPTKKPKRRLKAPAQTVREKAQKAQADSTQTPKNRRLRNAASKSRRPFAPVGRVLKKIFYRQPFKFIGRILLPRFVRNAYKELRLVTWPDARQTTRLTIAVLIFAVVFGVLIGAVDYVLDKIFKAIILE